MAAEARGVDQGAVAGLEVGLIGVDRGAPGRGPVILVCFTAADRPGLIAGLMIVQDGIAVGVLEIVGDAGKVRGPVSGLAVVATADDPGADGLVAAVGDPNALAYRGLTLLSLLAAGIGVSTAKKRKKRESSQGRSAEKPA